jgi:hypothetical protein
MAAKLSEIEVLKVVDESLGHLSEEERQRIFSFISSKYSLTPTNNTNHGSFNGQNSNIGAGQPITLDVKQFLASKKPSGFYEQIACLGYFIEKVQGQESFNTKAITETNTAARATKIPNPSLYLGDVVSKYGYMTAIGGGKKAMTARGEALVEALPDRDAVKTALENNPIKRKSTPKKKKAKK